MKLWVTGKALNPDEENDRWEFVGVFDSEENAVKACKDANYFVGPVELNEELPSETVPWTDGYYPRRSYREVEEKKKE